MLLVAIDLLCDHRGCVRIAAGLEYLLFSLSFSLSLRLSLVVAGIPMAVLFEEAAAEVKARANLLGGG